MLAIEIDMENEGGIDECLLPYLHSFDERTSQHHLGHLLSEIAKPLIEKILERTFSQDRENAARGILLLDAQDMTGDVLVKILRRLRKFKNDPTGRAIHNFRGLVATTTYRMVVDHQRENHRRRSNEERKLRRLFAANQKLAIWQDAQGNSICGYEAWRDETASRSKSDQERDISHDHNSLVEKPRLDLRERNTAEVILLILDKIGRPVRLNHLVKMTMVRIVESETISLDGMSVTSEDISELLVFPEPETELERRRLLEHLCEEMWSLSVLQRKALLLNMTDSFGYGIEWFTFTEVATQAQLAALLEVSAREFKELMTDKEIGNRLGVDSVKLVNIRKAVRDCLERCRRTFTKARKEK